MSHVWVFRFRTFNPRTLNFLTTLLKATDLALCLQPPRPSLQDLPTAWKQTEKVLGTKFKR